MEKQVVLIADDDPQIREILSIYLEKEGYVVSQAQDGAEAILKVQSDKPALLLLDIMMPVLDGIEVCKQVRKRFSNLPIIMITAKDEQEDRILGLEIGADDYITKPFHPREVMARVKAVLRRFVPDEVDSKRLVFDNLVVDINEFKVYAYEKEIVLTAKEMELLWCLASSAGQVFNRNQLLEKIWGYSYYGDTRTVDTHIKRLRHKLDIKEDSPWDIKTIWGVGYKFEARR